MIIQSLYTTLTVAAPQQTLEFFDDQKWRRIEFLDIVAFNNTDNNNGGVIQAFSNSVNDYYMIYDTFCGLKTVVFQPKRRDSLSFTVTLLQGTALEDYIVRIIIGFTEG